MAKLRCRRDGCRRRQIVKVIPAGDEAETVRAAVEAAAAFAGWGGSWKQWLCPPCSVEEDPH